MILIGYISSLLYGMLCLLLSFIAYKFGLSKIYSRKIVHILVGFEWMILYHTMGVGLNFVVVCLLFTLLLIISYRKKMFSMISSESDNAPGTVYYGVSMTVMAILSIVLDGFIFAFGIAVFCTSFGDGLAGVVGSVIKKCNPKIYNNKTLFGTIAAVLFCFASVMALSWIYELKISVFAVLMISLFAAGLELIATKGLDNITLPIGVSVLTYLFLYAPQIQNYIVPIVLTPYIIAIVLSKKLLTNKGVVAAVVLDVAVSVALANFGFVLLLSFLMLSVIIDKMKKHYKKTEESVSEKGEERDEIQVMANGLAPMIMAVLYLITNDFVFVIGYAVSIAEAFSDTAASGFGVFSKKAFDPFKMREVPKGLSGGMSIIGTISSVVMPFILLLIAVFFGKISIYEWILCSAFAFIGAFTDSFLGSVIQAKFKCKFCGKITERREHCTKKTELICGVRTITNDAVNLISSLFAAISAMAFWSFML